MTAKNSIAAWCLALAALAPASGMAAEALSMTVFRSPSCGCCHEWAEVMRAAGYEVELREIEDMAQVKRQAHVPADMESCHTAVLDGYFLEGHVPPEAVSRLVATRPAIAGLAVPGMPSGAPGMGDDPLVRYEVYAVPRDTGLPATVFHRVGAD